MGSCEYSSYFSSGVGVTTDASPSPQEWYLIARVDLHNALKHKATDPNGPGRPVQIQTACSISSVDCKAGTITTTDGKTVHGDLVVGADGIHSEARASVLGRDIPLVSTGTCCYRFLISVPDLLADPETAVFADEAGVFVQIAGEDRRICMYPCSAGKVMNFAAFVPRGEVGEIKKGDAPQAPPLLHSSPEDSSTC